MKKNILFSITLVTMLNASVSLNASSFGARVPEAKEAVLRDDHINRANDKEYQSRLLAEQAREEKQLADYHEQERKIYKKHKQEHKANKERLANRQNLTAEEKASLAKTRASKIEARVKYDHAKEKVASTVRKGIESVKNNTSYVFEKFKNLFFSPVDSTKSFYKNNRTACVIIGTTAATIAVTLFAIKNCRWLRQQCGLIDEEKDQVIVEDIHGNLHAVYADGYNPVVQPVTANVVKPVIL